MGFHNVLTGEDLHEPSRIRILNDVRDGANIPVTLLPNQLVRINGTVLEGILTVTTLAGVGDILVGFIDTIIPFGNEATIVSFGRLLDVEVEDPATNPLSDRDFLRVNSSSRFERIDSEEGRVATVLRRATSSAPTMNVLFNPTSSTQAPVPQIMMLNTPTGLPTGPSVPPSAIIPMPTGAGSFGRANDEMEFEFLNNSDFVINDQNDNLQISGRGISIERTGLYELSVPSNARFAGTFTTADALIPQSTVGSPVNTTVNFNIIVRSNRPVPNNPDTESDIFRVQATSTFTADGTTVALDLSGNIEASTSTSGVGIISNYVATGIQPKIVPLRAGDIITLNGEFIINRSVPPTTAGTLAVVYSDADPDNFFNFSMSIRRIT